MSILAQCSICQMKQSAKNKICRCGADLDKLKRSKRIKYWVNYRLPGGKQRREFVGYSITEARAADGKRQAQKHENRIFDVLPESKMTFNELTKWFLNLNSIKKLASYKRYESALNKFNKKFSKYRLIDIRQIDLEEYQIKRKEQGCADATVDMDIKVSQTMVAKAFDNDLIDGTCLKAFRKTKRLLEHGSNARKALITIEQYLSLVNHSSSFFRPFLIIAYNTGMRLGEIKMLEWSYIDKEKMMIRLPKKITKEKKAKNIPINHHVKAILDNLPRSIINDFVMTQEGKPFKDYVKLRKQFQNTCEKVGITYGAKEKHGIIFHDIRRTVKTNMLQAGVDKIYRDTILGHSLKGMDVHYIVPTDETLTKAMEMYTVWLDDQIAKALANVDQNVDQKQT